MDKEAYEINLIIEKYRQNSDLQCLNFSHRCLSMLPKEIEDFSNIKTLLLNNSKLILPPAEVSCFSKTLQELILANNNLTVIPSELGSLKKLKVLDLSFNNLGVLPEEIGNLESLQRLWINHCNLMLLPNQIGNLKSLNYLGVKQNKLQDFPSELKKLHYLMWLNCAENHLTDSSNFMLSDEIAYINLSHNSFQTIPTTIKGKPNLKIIILFNNKIEGMDDNCLMDLSAVAKLDLRENPIHSLPKHWKVYKC